MEKWKLTAGVRCSSPVFLSVCLLGPHMFFLVQLFSSCSPPPLPKSILILVSTGRSRMSSKNSLICLNIGSSIHGVHRVPSPPKKLLFTGRPESVLKSIFRTSYDFLTGSSQDAVKSGHTQGLTFWEGKNGPLQKNIFLGKPVYTLAWQHLVKNQSGSS